MGISRAIPPFCVAALLAIPAWRSRPPAFLSHDNRFSASMAVAGPRQGPPLPALRFTWAGDFAEGLAPVQVEGRFGFLDTAGTMRVAPRYEYLGGFSQGRAPALAGGKWGYLDHTGATAIPHAYDWAGSFREGLAPVAIGEGYGFIDTAGAPLGDFRYSDARPFSGGYAAVRIGDGEYGAWGFIDKRGNLAIPPLFPDIAGGFSEGLAAVRMESERPFRSGFIDTSGGFAIDTLYDAAGDFHEGLAPVGRGEWHGDRFRGIWGYVDSTGRPVTPMAYAEAGAFRGGKALVRLSGGGSALIARDGRILKSLPGDVEAYPPGAAMVTYKIRNLRGFMDPLGAGAIDPAFAEAGPFNCGRARVRLLGAGSRPWAFIGGNGGFLGNASNVTGP